MQNTKIGLGLAAIGRPDYINIRAEKEIDKSFDVFENNALELLNHAYLNGIKHFDTAPSYGKGEQFLVDWNVKHQYQDVELSTKWGYTYVANWKIGYEGDHEIKEHSLRKLLEQWNSSKKLLPALKTYQIHSATLESRVLENESVLNHLILLKREFGLKIGLSSSGVNQKEILQKALDTSVEGELLFDSFQVTFNVFEQSCFGILSQLINLDKQVIIKESMANGRVFLSENVYSAPNATLTSIASKYQVGIDAICLRFVMDYLKPSIVLSGASSIDQLNQNLKANSFSLSKEDIAELKKLIVIPEKYWKERKALEWN